MNRIEKFFVNNTRTQRSRVERARDLLQRADLADARNYLEIGCGAGAVTHFAASSLGLDATGVDLDPDQIALARRQYGSVERATFIEADAAQLQFADAQFDVVLSFMTTHHIAELDGALSEIRRVLRPGGYFAYSDIFLAGPIAWFGGLLGHEYELPPSDKMIARLRQHDLEPVWATRPDGRFNGTYTALYRRRDA
jgi:ubiquinone/menaquinone biosynthesis C-methylase UbiE